ncbi:MAG: hypothetical protein H8D97_00245, partial [Proteobacteria bacterium]|nr:hypothetical protein [Pseudomonadota bacterium]
YMENSAAIAEVTDITCLAGTGLNEKYFTISKLGQPYHVWFNEDAAGNDPDPVGSSPIEVQVLSTDTNAEVATKVKVQMILRGFGVTDVAQVLTVTEPFGGDVTDATAGDSGFTILVTTQGVDATYSWQSIGTSVELDRVINLADADESIFEFNDGVWEDQGDYYGLTIQ